MVSKHITSELLSLDAAEKAQIIQLLLQSISDSWAGIEKTPDICGGDACIAGTRIAVWVVVQARDLGTSEVDILRDYPSLSAQDLVNAWTYAASHTDEIAQAIKENNEA